MEGAGKDTSSIAFKKIETSQSPPKGKQAKNHFPYNTSVVPDMATAKKYKYTPSSPPSKDTINVFTDLNAHMGELMTYFETTNTKKASPELLSVLYKLKEYCKKTNYIQFMNEIGQHCKLDFLPAGRYDHIDMMDPYVTTNTSKNINKIQFIQSIYNTPSIEFMLYGPNLNDSLE